MMLNQTINRITIRFLINKHFSSIFIEFNDLFKAIKIFSNKKNMVTPELGLLKAKQLSFSDIASFSLNLLLQANENNLKKLLTSFFQDI